ARGAASALLLQRVRADRVYTEHTVAAERVCGRTLSGPSPNDGNLMMSNPRPGSYARNGVSVRLRYKRQSGVTLSSASRARPVCLCACAAHPHRARERRCVEPELIAEPRDRHGDLAIERAGEPGDGELDERQMIAPAPAATVGKIVVGGTTRSYRGEGL